MFEGSEHHDRDYFQPLQQAGAAVNGSTNADRTNYWEVVPTGALELALWMESDRMGLPAAGADRGQVRDPARRRAERAAAELREPAVRPRHDGAASARCSRQATRTTGRRSAIRATCARRASTTCGRSSSSYYHPRNALAGAGGRRVNRGRAPARRRRTSAASAAAGRDRPAAAEAPLVGDVRLVYEDRVELPRLYLGWHSPAIFAAGRCRAGPAGRRAGRRQELAPVPRARLRAAPGDRGRGGTELPPAGQLLQRRGHRRAGSDARRDRSRASSDEIGSLLAAGPDPDELDRSLAQAEAHFIYRLQSVGGFGGKADQLNLYQMYVGDPSYLNRDWQRYQEATSATIRDTGVGALAGGGRIAVSVVPNGRLDLALSGSEAVRPS